MRDEVKEQLGKILLKQVLPVAAASIGVYIAVHNPAVYAAFCGAA